MNTDKLKDIISTTDECIQKLNRIDLVKNEVASFVDDFDTFKKAAQDLVKDGQVLKIGIVGQVKAGKSSFLNSLFFDGESVLPKASTPMTAGLTVLEYVDSPNKQKLVVEFFSKDEWAKFERDNSFYEEKCQEIRAKMNGQLDILIDQEIKNNTTDNQRAANELVTMCKPQAKKIISEGVEKKDIKLPNMNEFQKQLEDYVGANGVYTPIVKALHIYLHKEEIKDLMIVDTPGVNDPIRSRENCTKDFLESCHGVIFLSAADAFMDSKDISFLNNRISKSGIGKVMIVASQYDNVLQSLYVQFRGTENEGDFGYIDQFAFDKLADRIQAVQNELNVDIVNVVDEEGFDNNGIEPSCGIGYSIWKKKESELDPTEKKVKDNMQKYFPSKFSDDRYKDEFFKLANIEGIKDKYIDNEFKKNKEEIINKKVTSYFSGKQEAFKKQLDDIIKAVENRRNIINGSDIAQLENEKNALKANIKRIENNLVESIGNFQGEINGKVVKMKTGIRLDDVNDWVSLTNQQFEVTFKGTMWGHNTELFSSDYYDYSQTDSNIKKSIENYTGRWQSEWEEYFKDCKGRLFKQASDLVADLSHKMSSSQMLEEAIRHSMVMALQDVDNNKIVDLQKCKVDTIDGLTNCLSLELPIPTIEKKRDLVQVELNKITKSALVDVGNKLTNQRNNIPTKYQNALKPYADDTNNKLSKLRNDFHSEFERGINEYFKETDAEIRNKKAIIPQYDSAIKELKNILKALS